MLRVVSVKSQPGGSSITATISVQNIRRYIALGPSFVRMAVKESPPLSPWDEDGLFVDAPFQKEKRTTPKTSDAVDWQHQGIIAFQSWYPGDIKSGTIHGVIHSNAEGLKSGDEGWYVITRALFSDKLGAIPYRDSCTFFSVKIPQGGPCINHND